MEDRIPILYEDHAVIVCEKPPGIASQKGKGFQADVTDILKIHIQRERGDKKEPYLGIIHRLDQPAGGIMVYAKTPEAAASLSAQTAGRQMKKQYYAVLEGSPLEKEGVLIDYLLRDGKTNTSKAADSFCRERKDVKRAELSYRVLEEIFKEEKSLALADISLKTGRHHQIRVQFAHMGCPLYGDLKYNTNAKPGNLGLYARALEFVHPMSKKIMKFEKEPSVGIFCEFSIINRQQG